MAKLTNDDKLDIIIQYEDGIRPAKIAMQYKVNVSTIGRLVRRYREHGIDAIQVKYTHKVYDEELGYAGTFDILFYFDSPTNPDKSGFLILDFKTNEDLFKNFKDEKLLKPFTGLLDMPISIYKLQLSLYENCLDKIGLKTIGRRILWLKPDGVYEKINLESYMGVLRKTLSETNLMKK